MTPERLELVSAHGDQTLHQVRFVVHGSSQAEGKEIEQRGFSFIEARATVSTSIIQAMGYATDPLKRGYSKSEVATIDDPGRISVIAIPAEFHLGYGTFTTAFVDRSLKIVLGAPLRYAGARKQLALYRSEDTEAARMRVESEVLGGFPLDNHPAFMIDRRLVVGGFHPNGELKTILTHLEVSAKAFEPIDFTRLERSLQAQFEVQEAAQAVLVPTMVRDLIVGTIESVIMSRLRMMHWQGLALLGYSFREGHDPITIVKPKDITEHRKRIDEYDRLLASSALFNGELAWLKTYGARALDMMRVELAGAELEAD